MLMEFVIFMAFSIQFSAPENPSMHPVRVQVKHSTSGINGAAWKHVESKDIAYRVLTSTLKQRAVVVVNS